MSEKWYNVLVSVDAPFGQSALPDETRHSSDAARTAAQIAASVPTQPPFLPPDAMREYRFND